MAGRLGPEPPWIGGELGSLGWGAGWELLGAAVPQLLGKVGHILITCTASPGWDSGAGLLSFFFWKLLPLSLFHCFISTFSASSLSSSCPPFFFVSPFLQELLQVEVHQGAVPICWAARRSTIAQGGDASMAWVCSLTILEAGSLSSRRRQCSLQQASLRGLQTAWSPCKHIRDVPPRVLFSSSSMNASQIGLGPPTPQFS